MLASSVWNLESDSTATFTDFAYVSLLSITTYCFEGYSMVETAREVPGVGIFLAFEHVLSYFSWASSFPLFLKT